MNSQYRKIIHYCIALVTLLAIVLIMPSKWEMKIGKSPNEYDQEWNKASDAALLADTREERQAALHRVKGLYDYRTEGHINEIRDMGWTLKVFRFVLIVAILSLCWLIMKMVFKELRRLRKAEKATAKGSVT